VATDDLDIVIADDEPNHVRLVAALAELGGEHLTLDQRRIPITLAHVRDLRLDGTMLVRTRHG
jgi:hypothetical protein